MVGDSIFATSGLWAYGGALLLPTAMYANPAGNAINSEQPFQLTHSILSRKLYDMLMRFSLNTPIYRRFDHGSTFDYVLASPTFGTDLTPGSKFFTESGTFITAITSDVPVVTDDRYEDSGPLGQIPMSLTDAKATYPGATWYRSGAQEGYTRVTFGASSYIEFTIPSGYSKFRVKLRKTTDGDLLTTTLTNCTGDSTIDLAYGTILHTNNSYFIDVEFVIINDFLPSTIRLTKTADTSKCLAYWGCVWFNEPCTIVNNYAYGGTSVGINKYALPDLLLTDDYDFVIWEPQLLNDVVTTTYELSKAAIEDYADILIAYDKPILALLPQKGAREGEVNADYFWGMCKAVLADKGIPFLDLGLMESSAINQIGKSAAQNYIFSTYGGVHPVGKGVDAIAMTPNSLINN